MKLSEFIQGVGRPVAYYPRLARVVGGVKQAVLICQLIYWYGKSEAISIHKTAEEIEDETGLTYEEQKVARAYLKKLGVLKDSYARLDHWVNFEIDFDCLNEIWEQRQSIGVNPDGQKAGQEIGIGVNPDGHRGKPRSPSGQIPFAIGVNPDRHRGKATFANKVSETTTETTTEISFHQNEMNPPSAAPSADALQAKQNPRTLDTLIKPWADRVYQTDRKKYDRLVVWIKAAERTYTVAVIASALEKFLPSASEVIEWWPYLDKILDKEEARANGSSAGKESDRIKRKERAWLAG